MSGAPYYPPPPGWAGMQSPPPPQPQPQPQPQSHPGQRPTYSDAPPLPPRPAGGPPTLAARSSLSFPPPPRSPNRPPQLPPRRQHTPSQMNMQPIYGQPRHRKPVPGHPTSTGTLHTQPVSHAQPAQPAYVQPMHSPQTPQPAYSQQAYSQQTYPQQSYPQPQQSSQPVSQPFQANDTSSSGGQQFSYFPQGYPPPPPPPPAAATAVAPSQPLVSAPSSSASPTPAPSLAPSFTGATTVTISPPPPYQHEIEQPAAPSQVSILPAGPPNLVQTTDQQITDDKRSMELPQDSVEMVDSLLQSLTVSSGADYGSPTLPAELPSDTQYCAAGHKQEASRQGEPVTPAAPAVPAVPAVPVAPAVPAVPTVPAASADDSPRSPPPQTAGQGPAYIHPVRSCIDSPMDFPTTWYSHSQAPQVLICSRCYIDSIWPTQFRNEFKGTFYSDKVSRVCRFKKHRITEQLLKEAVSSGQLRPMLDFMSRRLHIPDCKRTGGAKGTEGVKWFRPCGNAIPGMVTCEACYEDVVLASPLASCFELAPGQKLTDVWACDMCLPFLNKEFIERSKTADWAGFVQEAKARMQIPACAKDSMVLTTGRKWFIPVSGPPDMTLCAACYCDRVLKSGDEALWESNHRRMVPKTPSLAVCCMSNLNIAMAMSAAEDMKDRSIFWRAVAQLSREPACDPKGIKGQTRWFTFPSRPTRFVVCGACHAGLLETLDIARFFVPVPDPPAADVAWLCSMNKTSTRFSAYISKMLQTWFTGDGAAWEEYAATHAAVRACPGSTDCRDAVWYGWPDCCICEECYVDFARGTELDSAAAMPLRGVTLADPHICDMYSPRMRGLYEAACQRTPPDPAELLTFSTQRRVVYWQTMPICRNILAEQMFRLNQANMLRFQSVAATGMGNLQSVSQNHKSDHTYGMAGVGYGYENQHLLDAAKYNVEANQVSSQIGGNKILLVGHLEGQWKMVE